jgi:tetratricopeptide (TPR) repeat protein
MYMTGDGAGAAAQFVDLTKRAPEFAPAHYSLAVVHLSKGQEELALEQLSLAVRFDPTYLAARLQLAHLLRRRGRAEQSLLHYASIVKADPRIGEARFGEVLALVRLGRFEEAEMRLAEALALFPNQPEFLNALARLYAASPKDEARNGTQALMLADRLIRLGETPLSQQTMAMALAEQGRFQEAVQWQQRVLAFSRKSAPEQAGGLAADLHQYELGRPSRVPWRQEPAWQAP